MTAIPNGFRTERVRRSARIPKRFRSPLYSYVSLELKLEPRYATPVVQSACGLSFGCVAKNSQVSQRAREAT